MDTRKYIFQTETKQNADTDTHRDSQIDRHIYTEAGRSTDKKTVSRQEDKDLKFLD